MNKIYPLLLIFFISGSFTVAFSSVAASELATDSWNTKTPMDYERANFRVIAVDNKIYAIGGSYETEVPSFDQYPLFVTNYLGTNERYDPKTDTWVTLVSMPSPRAGFAIAAWHGKIYCIGGVTGNSEMYSRLGINEVYDIASDSWSTKASPMFNSEWWVQAQVVDGKIFVIVGSGEDYTFGNLYMYDPETDVWTEKASIPTDRTTNDYYLVSTVVDDKIMVVCIVSPDYPYGGLGQMVVMVYNPKTDVWSEEEAGPGVKVASGPLTVGTTTGVYAPKMAYFLGYDRPWRPIFWIYDPEKYTWTTAAAVESYEGGVAVVDDILYVISATETMQYVPVGYHSVAIPPNPSESQFTSKPEPFDSSLTNFIVAILIMILATATASLVFYSKKRKSR